MEITLEEIKEGNAVGCLLFDVLAVLNRSVHERRGTCIIYLKDIYMGSRYVADVWEYLSAQFMNSVVITSYKSDKNNYIFYVEFTETF